MRKRKILCIVLCLCIALFAVLAVVLSARKAPQEPIVILYENDVHCATDGYSKLLAMKKELAETYPHVGVVSSGDFIQGGTLGAVSKGEYIIHLMNLVGYDAIALGNHEFDYQISRLLELNDISDTKFLSCNFTKTGENDPLFAPFSMVAYGNVDVAYIGITSPTTITSSNPAQFKNEAGEFIYTFNDDRLHALVQSNIDAARKAGADYIIALSHVGYSEEKGWADITDVIANTEGLDAVLDAHSHSVIGKLILKDKSGSEVLLTSTGTKFANIGRLTITEDGLDIVLVDTAAYENTDPELDAVLAGLNESYAQLGGRVIGESVVVLNTHDGETRLVRNSETALGNLCSDALRITTGADIAYVNGGGLRAPLEAGEVTFNDIFSVFPYNNQVVTIQVTGQMILDMLEKGLMAYPEENGPFPNMSGLTFSVDTSIPSSVVLDANGFFAGVEGEYRVYDIMVLNQNTGVYEPLSADASYTLAGFNYNLIDGGDGLSMFAEAGVIDDEGILDIELLETYIADYLDGIIGEEYSHPQGRITFTTGK